jgi:hypothetical protein
MISRSTIKQALLVTLLMTAGIALFVSAPTAFAQLISPGDAPSLISNQTGGEGDIRELAKTILNFALGFLGFLAVVYIIYGGFLYVTAGGEEEPTGKAKKIIMYSIVGIVIILASFAIVNTILKAPTGASTTVTTQ